MSASQKLTVVQKMKPELSRRIIGGVAALAGLWWTCVAIYPGVFRLWRDDIDTFGVIFVLATVPLMTIPGILALFYGVRLFREMSESLLKWVVGLGAVFLAFFLSSRLSLLFPTLLPEGLLRATLLFVSSLAVIPVYFLVVRFLIRQLTNGASPASALLSRSVVILMAWQLWLLLLAYFHEYSPKEGYSRIPEEPWGLLGVVVPIIVAYGSYRFVSATLNKKLNGSAHPTASNVPV
jgi:hypothetical protein